MRRQVMPMQPISIPKNASLCRIQIRSQLQEEQQSYSNIASETSNADPVLLLVVLEHMTVPCVLLRIREATQAATRDPPVDYGHDEVEFFAQDIALRDLRICVHPIRGAIQQLLKGSMEVFAVPDALPLNVAHFS